MLRTFIAARIEPLRSIRRVLEELNEWGHPVKAVAAENLHLTLKFLGETPDERIGDVCNRLRELTAAHPPLQLELRTIDCFPHLNRPAVIWIGVEEIAADPGCPQLTQLSQHIDQAMAELGFQPESRPWRAHLTLARIKGRPPEPLKTWIQEASDRVFGQTELDQIQLVQSTLERSGPRYVDMAKFELDGELDPPA